MAAVDNNENEEVTVAGGFFKNLIDFIDLCISVVSRIEGMGYQPECNSAIMSLGRQYIINKNPDKIIRNFIKLSNSKWENYTTKNEKNLFLNLREIFGDLPGGYIENIIALFGMKDPAGVSLVTPEDIDDIWAYLTEFIKIAIFYVHEARCWCILPSGKPGYSKIFEKTISVKKYAALFKVKLDYGSE
jgi:hypothetical protein